MIGVPQRLIGDALVAGEPEIDEHSWHPERRGELANKLAGQRAKFSRARAIYTTSDEGQRRRAAELIAEVLAEAPGNGFAEAEVTQGENVPGEARDLIGMLSGSPSADDPDELVGTEHNR